MKLTPPFHTEDGSVVDAFGEYVGTLDPNTAHQDLFLLNRPEAEYERQADEVIKLRDEMHVSSINFASACKEVADKTDDIDVLKAECERLKAETKRREEGELDCNLPAWREIDRLRAAIAAAKAEARELAKAVIDCLAGVSVSHDVDCLCADCIARRLARRILAETPAPSHDDKIHDAALEEAASCAETCRRCCGIGDDASPYSHSSNTELLTYVRWTVACFY